MLHEGRFTRPGYFVMIEQNKDKKTGELVSLIKERAGNIFSSRQLLCTESVLTVLNRGLKGGLSPELAVRLASGFPNGLGGSGCLCGALNGGILALGLFLGRSRPGLGNGKRVASLAGHLHDRFRDHFGSTCCRILTKKVKQGSRSHFDRCTELTGSVAGMAARLILDSKPALADQADWDWLRERETFLGGGLRRIAGTIRAF